MQKHVLMGATLHTPRLDLFAIWISSLQCESDDDGDLSTPQSLIQYLRSTLSSGIASTGVKHQTGECEHQHMHSSAAGSVLSFAMHTHRQGTSCSHRRRWYSDT